MIRTTGPAIALLVACYASHERVMPDGGSDAGTPDSGAPRLDADDPECVSRGEMAMVEGPSGRYRIDLTEVTEREYARFLQCAPERAVPGCEALTHHFPCDSVGFDLARAAELPVRCISWCSASAYCAWAGKRLCMQDEWSTACNATRARVAPDDFMVSGDICVLSAFGDGEWGMNTDHDVVRPVRTAPECRALTPPFDAVHDVIGNVEEFLGLCDGEGCRFAGNSFSSGPRMPCILEGAVAPEEVWSDVIGFRCCDD